MEKGYRVTYYSHEVNRFSVHKPDGSMRVFSQSSRGLYYMEDTAETNNNNQEHKPEPKKEPESKPNNFAPKNKMVEVPVFEHEYEDKTLLNAGTGSAGQYHSK